MSERDAGSQDADPRDNGFRVSTSRGLSPWMASVDASLVFTTYQEGRVFFIGYDDGSRITLIERLFDRAMGLAVEGDALYLGTLLQVLRFSNALSPGASWGEMKADRLYVPRLSWTTGDVDIHDVAVDSDGRVLFISTLYSCIAATSAEYSFEPVWRPPFVSRLAAEDRCHLNGLAMDNGRPRTVSAVSRSDIADGWRDHRRDGGVLVDVESREIVCAGLSMPHSPRWHDGRLYVLNSGAGEFGYIDTERGTFEAITFCPGYLRGLAFAGDCAIVGLSRPREKTFHGLPLDDALAERKARPQCGVLVIDLKTGNIAHWLRLDSGIEELYDVAVLPGTCRPAALNFRSGDVLRTITPGPEGVL